MTTAELTPTGQTHRQTSSEASPMVSIPLPEVALMVFSRLLQGDSRLLHDLGLSSADLYRLQALPSLSLPRLLARGGVIEVRLHHQALHGLLAHLNTDRRSESEIRGMIEAEASHPFMKHFFDMTYTVYHQYRQQAGLLRSAGRPTTPANTIVNTVTELLYKLDLLDPDVTVGPNDFMAIHQLTGHTLRDIWSVYQREKNSLAIIAADGKHSSSPPGPSSGKRPQP